MRDAWRHHGSLMAELRDREQSADNQERVDKHFESAALFFLRAHEKRVGGFKCFRIMRDCFHGCLSMRCSNPADRIQNFRKISWSAAISLVRRRGRTVLSILSRWERDLERRFNAAGPDRAPTDPCLKGAEQSDEDKDRCEQRCLRNETTTGKQENHGDSTTSDATFAVDIRLHLRGDAGIEFQHTLDRLGVDCQRYAIFSTLEILNDRRSRPV